MTGYECQDRECYKCQKEKSLDCCIERFHGIPASINSINVVKWMREKYHYVTLLPQNEIYMYNSGCNVKVGDTHPYMVLEGAFGEIRNADGNGILSEKLKDIIVRKLRHQTYTESYIQLSPTKIPYFDSDLNIINMCNGLFNWRTGEFKEHTFNYPSQIQIAVDYNKNAECPIIDEIIRDILKPSDVVRFYESFAYSFYRNYIMQNIFLLVGEASTGKSQLLDMLTNVIGSWNISHVTFQDLGGMRANRFSIIKMFGKLLNIAGDIDSNVIPEVGKIKMMCSGVDEIDGEIKHVQETIPFVNFAKPWYSANELPPINDKSDGFYRRAMPFACDVKFEIGGPKAERLKAISDPLELSGLFNKAIDYLPDLLERRKFTNQPSIEEVKSLYRRSSNTLEEFLDSCVTDHEGNDISKDEMFNCYRKYCKKYKLPSISNKIAFGKELRKVGFLDHYKSGIRNYKGDRRQCWLDIEVGCQEI